MSHFTVLVIGENPEQQLAPFQENNMGDCPEQYLAFIETEEEHRNDYETDTITKVVMPDGRLVSPYADEFNGSVPDGLEQRGIPVRELYATFEEYMKDYCHEDPDAKTGRYGYWENPNRKWDWYVLGGRWAGFFKIKDGAYATAGRGSLILGNSPKPGFADQALKGDIDFEYKRKEHGDYAAEMWDKVNEAIKDTAAALSWDHIRDEMFPGNIDEARTFYHSQERVVAFKKVEGLGWSESVQDYEMPREQFIQKARASAIATHAVIKDGVWYEHGSMGWWGVVTDEKDDWNEKFSELLDSIPDDTMLSVFDCHI